MGKIRAIIKRPDERFGHVTNISNSLKNLQNIVGGYIEVVPLAQNMAIICNEEGKIQRPQLNFKIGQGITADYICGEAIVVGVDGEEFSDLPIGFDVWKDILKKWGN